MSNSIKMLDGGVAVITGAGSGIGEGIARYAAELGMRVVLADIDIVRAEQVATSIREDGAEALVVQTDVGDPGSLDKLAETVFDTYGSVQLLVNNAGIETVGFSWEMSAAQWDKILDINIHGVVHGVRAFVPHMIDAGKPAMIANVASMGAFGIMPVQTSYIMSKHAVLAFSECLELEMQVKQLPIKVSVVLPGAVSTRIFKDLDEQTEPVIQHHHQVMKTMLETQGISGQEAGQRILDQIAAGEFWVTTHPEIIDQVTQQRAEQITARQRPVLSTELRQLLGLEQ